MHVQELYRYPVKGLSAEPLTETEVTTEGAVPWDRAFALAQGDAPFDPAAPAFVHKRHFMCLMANARIAGLQSVFEPAIGVLEVRAPGGEVECADVTMPGGRRRMAAFLTGFLGDEARGMPVLHHVPGHVFGDQREPVLSLFNLGSLVAYEAAAGVRRDKRRFRANVYFSGPEWCEFDWVGREVRIGSATLRVTKRTVRCAATEVNPDTAERDARPIAELRSAYGHADLGVHAAVVMAGRFGLGDAIVVV